MDARRHVVGHALQGLARSGRRRGGHLVAGRFFVISHRVLVSGHRAGPDGRRVLVLPDLADQQATQGVPPAGKLAGDPAA
jgi:hypothetical protein